jgi:hypothetical protein
MNVLRLPEQPIPSRCVPRQAEGDAYQAAWESTIFRPSFPKTRCPDFAPLDKLAPGVPIHDNASGAL